MKLNPDCIRDILLTIEETTTFSQLFEYDPDSNSHERLKAYSEEEILYHLRQCNEAGFLFKSTFNLSGGCIVIDLSPKAHQFLADIRSDNTWHKTKEAAKKIGSYSLDAITKIASGIVTSMINLHLQNS